MQSNVIIRLYEPRDRRGVRQIACDTADRGNPVESIFQDRELITDLLTRYYTDYERESLWIADYNGQVVGYLTGCLNSNRYLRFMNFYIIPRTIIKAILRGMLWKAELYRFIIAGFITWRLGGFKRYISFNKYPAHLHVNINKDFRGQHIGDFLVEKFIEQAKSKGIKGIHFGVREDNAPARNFFERMGFYPINRYAAVFPYGKIFQKHYTVIYGKEV